MRGDLRAGALTWCTTWLKVTKTTRDKRRPAADRQSPRHEALHRAPKKQDNLYWQVRLTAYDYDQWAKNDAQWIARPLT